MISEDLSLSILPVQGRFVARVGAVDLSQPLQDESRVLLDTLFAHAIQSAFIYHHRWRVGDLVLWDNRCTMHRASDYDLRHTRSMHRTTIQGCRPV